MTLQTAALALTVAGLLSAAVVFGGTRKVLLSVGVLLDLLTAAGLLRLSAVDASFRTILTAAVIIVIRKAAVAGLRSTGHGLRAEPSPRRHPAG